MLNISSMSCSTCMSEGLIFSTSVWSLLRWWVHMNLLVYYNASIPGQHFLQNIYVSQDFECAHARFAEIARHGGPSLVTGPVVRKLRHGRHGRHGRQGSELEMSSLWISQTRNVICTRRFVTIQSKVNPVIVKNILRSNFCRNVISIACVFALRDGNLELSIAKPSPI